MTDRTAAVRTLVEVMPDADVLASAVAARFVLTVLDAQAERGSASMVLTGGRIAAQVLRAVQDLPAARGIDWSRVDLWWGDERFLPSGHPDRNETQARAALLDALPLDPARVHPMAASDGPDGDDAAAGARRYAAELGDAHLDVVMLGVGEDGHVASIFPGHPAGDILPGHPAGDIFPGHSAGDIFPGHPAGAETGVTAAVYDSPKPPPVRITLTMPAIQRADEVWLIASGDGKADAVGAALHGADLPAARASGRVRTLWLLDQAAAAKR
ncbi:MAG TPA: 6-phosphogluconolactonase [Actinoplanes sp.]|nr:6-phosphogluconolactonase [Actinoplanes sp.]